MPTPAPHATALTTYPPTSLDGNNGAAVTTFSSIATSSSVTIGVGITVAVGILAVIGCGAKRVFGTTQSAGQREATIRTTKKAVDKLFHSPELKTKLQLSEDDSASLKSLIKALKSEVKIGHDAVTGGYYIDFDNFDLSSDDHAAIKEDAKADIEAQDKKQDEARDAARYLQTAVANIHPEATPGEVELATHQVESTFLSAAQKKERKTKLSQISSKDKQLVFAHLKAIAKKLNAPVQKEVLAGALKECAVIVSINGKTAMITDLKTSEDETTVDFRVNISKAEFTEEGMLAFSELKSDSEKPGLLLEIITMFTDAHRSSTVSVEPVLPDTPRKQIKQRVQARKKMEDTQRYEPVDAEEGKSDSDSSDLTGMKQLTKMATQPKSSLSTDDVEMATSHSATLK